MCPPDDEHRAVGCLSPDEATRVIQLYHGGKMKHANFTTRAYPDFTLKIEKWQTFIYYEDKLVKHENSQRS